MTSELVVVLTMGRVGSMSIHGSIPPSPGRQTYHVHSMNVATLTRQIMRKGGLEESARSVKEGVAAVKAVFGFPGKVRIVSLVRDIRTRETSAAFASLRATMEPEEVESILRDPEATRAFYWKKFSRGRPLVWFDNEIRDVIGIDVFARPFPARGWESYSTDRFDLLVVRNECDAETKSKVLAGFLDEAEFPIIVKNSQTESPGLAAMYATFKRNLAFTRAELDEFASTRYQRHFYGCQELPPAG